MMKLIFAALCVLLAVHLNEAVGQYPRGGTQPKTPVRINPYVMKYLQGYYKKHKTLPPALKRWAYQQLQKRNPSAPPVAPVPQVYQAPPVAVAPAPVPVVQYVAAAPIPAQYAPGLVLNPSPLPAPVVAHVATPQVAQAKSGYPQPQPRYPQPQPSYAQPQQTYPQPQPSKPAGQSYGDQCHGKVHPGWCSGKYAGHYTMAGSSSCYIQCDQWGKAYGKPCAPGTYWRYGGQEPTHYNHCI